MKKKLIAVCAVVTTVIRASVMAVAETATELLAGAFLVTTASVMAGAREWKRQWGKK